MHNGPLHLRKGITLVFPELCRPLWKCLLEEKSELFSEEARVLLPENLKNIKGFMTSSLPVPTLGGGSYVYVCEYWYVCQGACV